MDILVAIVLFSQLIRMLLGYCHFLLTFDINLVLIETRKSLHLRMYINEHMQVMMTMTLLIVARKRNIPHNF